MDYIARLRDEYDLFVWFIHHNRKAQAQNKRPNKLADIYGSQYITAAATTVMGIWPVGDELEITGLKVRLAKPFSKFHIRRTENLNFEIAAVGTGLLKSVANQVSVEETEDRDDPDNSDTFRM
jgi:hypothetical protein